MRIPQQVTRETFLAQLRESGLLTTAQLTEIVEHLPESPRGRVLARALVEMGLLTRFQAEQLLAGRSGGFFLGQYRILDELGRGGMGRVFKAIHLTMNRVVALKVLTAHFGRTERARDLFFREMQAIARLSHPNIVTAYDAGKLGERAYLVMEYVDGPSLDQLVQRQGPLPVGQACEFVRQAALGLQYAFEKGMVHRDIKPGNLLLAREGGTTGGCQVKILDFGLARLNEPQPFEMHDPDTILTCENVVLGTPDFVSPEQARNLHSADIRSDLYSLGCTFYYLLTGEVPFPDGTVMEKLIRHTTDAPTPVARCRPEVAAPIAAIVDRLLSKKPADRFETPAELAAALQPFALALPVAVAMAPPAPESHPVEHDSDEHFFWHSDTRQDGLASAMQATVPPSGSSTQYSVEYGWRPSVRPTPEAEFRQRVFIALGTAIGVIGALVGFIAILWGR